MVRIVFVSLVLVPARKVAKGLPDNSTSPPARSSTPTHSTTFHGPSSRWSRAEGFMMSTRFVFVWIWGRVRVRRDRHPKNSSSATRSPVSPKNGDDLSRVDIRFSVKGPNKFPLRSSMSVHERWFSPQHSSSISSRWTLQKEITCKPTYPVARSNQDLHLRVSKSSNWSLWLHDIYSYQSSAFSPRLLSWLRKTCFITSDYQSLWRFATVISSCDHWWAAYHGDVNDGNVS